MTLIPTILDSMEEVINQIDGLTSKRDASILAKLHVYDGGSRIMSVSVNMEDRISGVYKITLVSWSMLNVRKRSKKIKLRVGDNISYATLVELRLFVERMLNKIKEAKQEKINSERKSIEDKRSLNTKISNAVSNLPEVTFDEKDGSITYKGYVLKVIEYNGEVMTHVSVSYNFRERVSLGKAFKIIDILVA